MRVNFFYERDDDEPHLFTVEEMEVPQVGEAVWINSGGPLSEAHLPEAFRHHARCVVARRSFSVIVINSSGFPHTSAHAEILLRPEPLRPEPSEPSPRGGE